MRERQWRRYLHFWRRDIAADVDAELRHHFDQRVQQYVASGLTPDDAKAAARERFGDVDQVRSGLIDIDRRIERRHRVALWLDALRDDLRWSVRSWRRQPGFAIAVIVALGLGVGANAAVFTVLDRVFFQAPPGVQRPREVFRIYARQSSWSGSGPAFVSSSVSIPSLADLQTATEGIAQVAGFNYMSRRFGEGDARVRVGLATDGFFDLVGVRPARGRFFSPDELHYGDPRHLAVLSHALWRREFGADPAIVGRAVRLDTTSYMVIGVAPDGFEGLDLDVVDLWAPLSSLPGGSETGRWQRGSRATQVVARVNGGVDIRALESRLTTAYRLGNRDERWFDHQATIIAAPLLVARGPATIDDVEARSLSVAIRLAGVALIVLVIATSNVASLLLMRALRRRREIAVRIALGISRQRLVAQLLVESLLLGLVAGVAAIAVAQWAGAAMRSMLLGRIHWSATVVDHRVMILAITLGTLASLAAGLAPASLATRPDLTNLLKSSTPETGTARSTLRVALLVVQTALCMLLVSGAGVFVQSLRHATDADMGFDTDRLVTVSTSGFGGRLNPQDFDDALARVRALPSVEVAASATYDLRGGDMHSSFSIVVGDSVAPFAAPVFGYVGADYARAAGFRVLRGRALSSDDLAGSPPVAMINESMAKTFWPAGNAVGACFRAGYGACRTVIGIVGDVRWNVAEPVVRQYYVPLTQAPPTSAPNFVVRMRGIATPGDVVAIHRLIDPILGGGKYAAEVHRVAERLETQTHPWRVAATLFLLFGILALTSAGAGVYGLVGYDVTQRMRELGIRITLGATSREILQLVFRDGLRVVTIGVVVGTGAALAASRAIASLLFETSPSDPIVLALAAGVLMTTALLASAAPAWRATRVDPMVALRSE